MLFFRSNSEGSSGDVNSLAAVATVIPRLTASISFSHTTFSTFCLLLQKNKLHPAEFLITSNYWKMKIFIVSSSCHQMATTRLNDATTFSLRQYCQLFFLELKMLSFVIKVATTGNFTLFLSLIYQK